MIADRLLQVLSRWGTTFAWWNHWVTLVLWRDGGRVMIRWCEDRSAGPWIISSIS